jgi:hypothetical protein
MTLRAIIFVFTSISVFAQVDVLTRRIDNARSAVNSHETILNHNTVRTKFGKLWTLYADAKIMAQPLYVANLVVPAADVIGSVAKAKCPTGCNVVIFATMKGTIYAYLADEKPHAVNDTLLWARYLSNGDACHCGATGPQNGSGNFDMWAVDDPWWGVLGTPAIDRNNNSVYAVTWTNDQQYRLYNLNLKTGQIQQGPILIQGSVGGQTFAPNTPGWIQRRKQRAGLLLTHGLLYVAFGGDDHQALAGWLFVYDAQSLTMKTVWSPTPAGRNGGIWMAGEGPAADADGNVYIQTGDGDVDTQKHSYGDSLVRLQFTNGAVSVADFFTPCNQMLLQQCDLDHGSSGPVLFSQFVVGGGKNGWLYLMRADKLGQYAPGPFPPPAAACQPGVTDCTDGPNVIQKWQATHGHIHGAPVFWAGPGGKSWLYVMGEGDPLEAFPFDGNKFDPAAMKQSTWTEPHMTEVPVCQSQSNHGMWMPGGYVGVSSNGMTPGTGIVWAVVPANGDSNSCRGVKGMLMAFNAEDITKELWRSQAQNTKLSDTPDSFGLLARFNTPTVANGKVFVPTAGDAEQLQRWGGARPAQGPANYQLVVYGLNQ